MDWTIVSFLAAPFAASLILTGIHAYLGVHVIERASSSWTSRSRRSRRSARRWRS